MHGGGAVGVGLSRQAGVVGIEGLAVGEAIEVDGGAIAGLAVVLLAIIRKLLASGVGERGCHSRDLGSLVRGGVDARGRRGGLVSVEDGGRRRGVLLLRFRLELRLLPVLGFLVEGDEVVGGHRRGNVGGINGLLVPELLVLGDGDVVCRGVALLAIGGAARLDHLSGGLAGQDDAVLRAAEETEDRLDGRWLVLRVRSGRLDVKAVVGKRCELRLLVILGGSKVCGDRSGGDERTSGGAGGLRRGDRRRGSDDYRLGLHVLDLAALGKHAEALHDVGAVADTVGLHGDRRGRDGLRHRSGGGLAILLGREVLDRNLGLSGGGGCGLGRLLHGLNGVVDGLNAVDALQAGGAHVLEHAEHGCDAGLVVVGTVGAVGEVLEHAGHAEDGEGQRGEDADNPHEAAEGLGEEREGLEQHAHADHEDAVLGHAPDQRNVGRHRRGAKHVLVRGVVVGHDHDGAVALDDVGAAGLVEGHDVLAARGRAKRRDEVMTEILEDEERGGTDGEHKADDRKHGNTDAPEHDAHEHQRIQKGGHGAAERLCVELLDARLDIVLAHEVGNGVGRLELLLAAGGANAHLLIEIVHVVVCHGHCEILRRV